VCCLSNATRWICANWRRWYLEAFDPLLVQVKNMTTSSQAAFAGGEGLSRAELEQQVFVNLIGQNAELREQSELWAATALSIQTPGAVAHRARRHSRRIDRHDGESKVESGGSVDHKARGGAVEKGR
jgi:hypothetical protein